MHFSVPIECLAASGETSTGICAPEIALLELDLEVGTDCKLQVSAIGSFDECVEQHGALEYYWGLRPGDLRIQTNTQSTIHRAFSPTFSCAHDRLTIYHPLSSPLYEG